MCDAVLWIVCFCISVGIVRISAETIQILFITLSFSSNFKFRIATSWYIYIRSQLFKVCCFRFHFWEVDYEVGEVVAEVVKNYFRQRQASRCPHCRWPRTDHQQGVLSHVKVTSYNDVVRWHSLVTSLVITFLMTEYVLWSGKQRPFNTFFICLTMIWSVQQWSDRCCQNIILLIFNHHLICC